MISAGYIVRATYLAVTQVLQKRLEAYRLTSPQWYFMREIWIQEGLSQRELSERVGTAESTTVSALRVLERRRLIYREAKPLDRRTSRVYLTERGHRLREEVLPIIAAVNKIALKGLSVKEIKAMDDALAGVRSNLWRYMEKLEAQEPLKSSRRRKGLRPVQISYFQEGE